MKAKDYHEMSTDELSDRLGDLQRNLFDLRTQAVTEKLENSKAIRNIRRDIARLKTIICERTRASSTAEA
jgi:large subunit ribosomal protein L29